jgi:hypothetical protein
MIGNLDWLRFACMFCDADTDILMQRMRRYVHSVLLDPYANSFDYSAADRRCNMGAWTLDNTTKRDPTRGAW